MRVYFTSKNAKGLILKQLLLLTASMYCIFFPIPVVFSEPEFENRPPNMMFQAYVEYSEGGIFDEYAYLSSSSRALVQCYQELIDKVVERFAPPPGSIVVDIGCTDGIMLGR